jgi:hypothetical protein
MIPNLLYKYVSPKRIDVLINKRIRFTKPCFLNDPFEFRPGMPEAPGHFEAKIAKKREAACEDESRNSCILSLAERRDLIPMWAHYADEHRGFVIGFDTGSAFFSQAIADRKLRPVRYQQERVSLTRGLLPDQPSVKPDAIFRTKSLDWAYEQEWRWVECCDPSQPIYLRPIPSDSIREVVLGYRIDPKTAEAILALKSIADYEHVRLFRVVLSKSHYSLEVEPL